MSSFLGALACAFSNCDSKATVSTQWKERRRHTIAERRSAFTTAIVACVRACSSCVLQPRRPLTRETRPSHRVDTACDVTFNPHFAPSAPYTESSTYPPRVKHMPGLISPSSASSGGAIAAMKRAHDGEGATHQGASLKKRKVLHKLHHTQPVQYLVDPISAEFGFGDSKDFYDQQLRRAIAIQCKSLGFDSARPDALEEFRGLVDSCTTNVRASGAWLTQRRHDQVFNTRANVHDQRATYRNCSPRLDICACQCRPTWFRSSRAAFRHRRDTSFSITTTLRATCPARTPTYQYRRITWP